MVMHEFMKSKPDLLEIAEGMLALARQDSQSVYRYRQTIYNSLYIERGRKNITRCGFASTYNVEDIDAKIYSSIHGEELFPFNLSQFETWRKRSETPFIFSHKGIPLPTETHVVYHPLPSNYDQWDEDLTRFTREYKNERVTREFGVEQQIIVNSHGGMVVESRPFFSIHYRQGYHPHMITRSVGAYVRSNKEIDRIPLLIRYLPDPTPDERVRKSTTFTDAFARLHEMSHTIHYENLDEAGLNKYLTLDVIMLSGVPVHEIFGHQFEEPIHPLNVGQQSLFPIGKNVQNSHILLRDDPTQVLEELEVLGSYHFDCYGRKAKPTLHIADSQVQEHLGGEYIDLKNLKTFLGIEKSPFVGSTRQGDEGSFPQPRMSCTVLEGEEEAIDPTGKLVMVPFDGYVLDGNFFKVMSSECYVIDGGGVPRRLCPLEGSRAIYDSLIGMHVLPGKSHHIGTCSKPNLLDDHTESEVMVSFLANHQMWEHLTIRTL